jgi:hypothetical protein
MLTGRLSGRRDKPARLVNRARGQVLNYKIFDPGVSSIKKLVYYLVIEFSGPLGY